MIQISSLETVKIVEIGFHCIWNLESETCFYNPYNPPIYFSLGDALTAVGLLFAVIQLISPIKKITLAIKGFREKILWIVVGVALSFIMIAANVPQLQYLSLTPPLNYALLWEFLGFLLFILAIIWFWLQANKYRNIYSEKNAARFFKIILREIANGKDGYLEASINILDSNLERIINGIKNDSNPEMRRYSSSLLNYVLSEKEVLSYVVTSRIDFIFHFLVLIKEREISHRDIGFVVSIIIKELYNNSNSYLYKQIDDHRGVSLFASLYEEIFKQDQSFLREFNILNVWNSYSVSEETLLNKDYICVYLKSIKNVIEANGLSEPTVCSQISSALYELENYVRRANWLSKNDDKWYGSEVGDFLGRTFPELYEESVKNQTIQKTQNQYVADSKKYTQNISASFAQSLVDYLCLLANYNDVKMQRTYALEATERILSIHKNEFDFETIREYFLEFIWKNIEDNVIRGHYPAVLRIYLHNMLWNDANMPDWRKSERTKLVNFLYKQLIPRLKKKELMADFKTLKEEILLPDYIKFSKNKLWRVERDGVEVEISV